MAVQSGAGAQFLPVWRVTGFGGWQVSFEGAGGVSLDLKRAPNSAVSPPDSPNPTRHSSPPQIPASPLREPRVSREASRSCARKTELLRAKN